MQEKSLSLKWWEALNIVNNFNKFLSYYSAIQLIYKCLYAPCKDEKLFCNWIEETKSFSRKIEARNVVFWSCSKTLPWQFNREILIKTTDKLIICLINSVKVQTLLRSLFMASTYWVFQLIWNLLSLIFFLSMHLRIWERILKLYAMNCSIKDLTIFRMFGWTTSSMACS